MYLETKMKNKLILWIILSLLLVVSVTALEECGETLISSESCTVVTPYISYCSAYTTNVTYSNGTNYGNFAMSQINSLGIYNFTLTLETPDTYIIKLCDDSVRPLTVIDIDSIGTGSSIFSYILQIFYNTLPGAW